MLRFLQLALSKWSQRKKKKKEGGEEWKEKKARQGEKRMSRDFFKRRGLPDPQQPK